MALTLTLLIGFFALALVARVTLAARLCALCASVGLTWVTLWVIAFVRGGADPIIVAMLMGGSAVGILYYLSAKLPEAYGIFTFPFLITLFWLIHTTITGPYGWRGEGVLLVGVWTLAVVIFFARTNGRFRGIARNLISCCRNW